jgi:AcrR family transcriptional regulator
MKPATPFDDLPLRQRKHARTKLALLESMLAALEERSLEEVTVKDLCREVGVSEGTFFNYFPSKPSVLVYYVQLWSLEMGWHATRWSDDLGGLAAIEAIFASTARELARRPNPMGEIIAWQARTSDAPVFHEIGLAERLLAFPELPGVEHVVAKGLDELLPPLVRQAIERGELPSELNVETVLIALASLFFGIPVVMRRMKPDLIEGAYRTQLRILWTGLGAGPKQETP